MIIVSYNTRELTLKAVETLIENSAGVAMRIVVFDNASADGSAEAVAQRFPEVEVIASPENLGFAAANNRVGATATTLWLCLLNPDTEPIPARLPTCWPSPKRIRKQGPWAGARSSPMAA